MIMLRALLSFALFSQLAVVLTAGYSSQPTRRNFFVRRCANDRVLSSPTSSLTKEADRELYAPVDRRTAAVQSSLATLGVVAFGGAFTPRPASAASEMPAEFKNVGGQAPPPEGETPFRTLPDGVKVKDFRGGTGDATVGDGSKVAVALTGRLLNLNGVVFYDTKKNDPDGFGGVPLSFAVGDGTALPGLESGLRGMRKGGIRRIIVPPELGYTKFPGREPVPLDAIDQRALDSVIKNPRRDATLLFDVKLERLK